MSPTKLHNPLSPFDPVRQVQREVTSGASLVAGVEALQRARASAAIQRAADGGSEPLADQAGNPFAVVTVDLGSAAFIAGGHQLGSGCKVMYLADGSTAGGRLELDFGGLAVVPLAPGQWIRTRFRNAVVRRSSLSAVKGLAKLLVMKDSSADFSEDNASKVSQLLTPVDLLGDSKTPTFIAVAEDTQPSGAAPVGSFNMTGFKLLRLLIDGQAANTLTTADIIPWARDPDTGLWAEGGGELVAVPDSASSGYRYRSFLMSVRGFGLMYPEIRNLLPALQTQLGLIVQGIE